MGLATAIIGGSALVIGGVTTYLSAKKQSDAARDAASAAATEARIAREQAKATGEKAAQIIFEGGRQARHDLAGQTGKAVRQVESTRDASLDELYGARDRTLDAINTGYDRGEGIAQDYGQRAIDTLTAGTEQARADIQQGLDRSTGVITQGADRGERVLTDRGNAALEALGLRTDQAAGELRTGRDAALANVEQGRDRALEELASGTRSGVEALQGVADLVQYGDQAAQMAGQSYQDVLGGFEASPGYEFRRSQGEQAVARANAARGGRLSGRQLQALSDYNQGLASTEFENYASRALGLRAQNLGVLSGLAQLGASGASQQASLYGAQAQTGAGLADSAGVRMGDINLGTADALAGLFSGAGTQEAAINTNLGNQIAGLRQDEATALAGLLERSGVNMSDLARSGSQDVAGVHGGLGELLTNLAVNRGQNVGDVETTYGNRSTDIIGNSGMTIADLFQQLGINSANVETATAANRANALQGGQGQAIQALQPLTNAIMAPVQYAGGTEAAIANTFNNIAQGAITYGLINGGNSSGSGSQVNQQEWDPLRGYNTAKVPL